VTSTVLYAESLRAHPEVIVLRAGYSRAEAERPGQLRAACAISLVRGTGVRILVDTGGPAERQLLIEKLAEQGLAPDDIQVVVCTHGHIDHVGNANLFPRATFLSGQDRCTGDLFSGLDFAAGPVTIAPDVEVLPTPGHTSEDLSVLVRTSAGVVAIAGDVFENGDPADTAWQDFSRNVRQQQESRAALLAVAELIVPGHGNPFATSEYRRGGGLQDGI
jgi:glyoxylase-like metal-dependent hydrolase (beta-lactamase superfamily II)